MAVTLWSVDQIRHFCGNGVNHLGSSPAIGVIRCHCSCGLGIVTASIELLASREYKVLVFSFVGGAQWQIV